MYSIYSGQELFCIVGAAPILSTLPLYHLTLLYEIFNTWKSKKAFLAYVQDCVVNVHAHHQLLFWESNVLIYGMQICLMCVCVYAHAHAGLHVLCVCTVVHAHASVCTCMCLHAFCLCRCIGSIWLTSHPCQQDVAPGLWAPSEKKEKEYLHWPLCIEVGLRGGQQIGSFMSPSPNAKVRL